MRVILLLTVSLLCTLWLPAQNPISCGTPSNPVPSTSIGLRGNTVTPFCNNRIPSRLLTNWITTDIPPSYFVYAQADALGEYNCNLNFSALNNPSGIAINFNVQERYDRLSIINGVPTTVSVEELLTPKGDGVSTIDILLIQSHILGTNPLNAAWEYVAADPNGDGHIDVGDMISIRRFLLFSEDSSLHRSWDYRDKETYDLFTTAPNRFDITSIEKVSRSENTALGSTYSPTQIGIKVGDLNASCSFYGSTTCFSGGGDSSITKAKSSSLIQGVNQFIEKNEYLDVEFSMGLENGIDLSALGLSFLLDNSVIELVSISADEINIDDAIYISDDLSELKLLWIDMLDGYSGSPSKDFISITLRVKGLARSKLSNAITLNGEPNLANTAIFADEKNRDFIEKGIEIQWKELDNHEPPSVTLLSGNPFSDKIVFNVIHPIIEDVAFLHGRIYDANGRILRSRNKVITTSENTITFNDVEHLSPGIYFYSILYNETLLASGKLLR